MGLASYDNDKKVEAAMTDRTIKIILWVITLGAAWDLGRSIDSLLLFAVSGVVPGTNRALTPNQSLIFSGVFLFISLLLIFSTNMRRALKRAFGYRAEDEAEDVVEAVVPVVAKKTRKKATKPAVVYETPKQPGFLVTITRRLIERLGQVALYTARIIEKRFPSFAAACVRLGKRIEARLTALYGRVVALAKRVQKKAYHFAVAMSMLATMEAIRFWHWAEPYLRRTDDWLGKQYKAAIAELRKNDTVKAAIRLSHETDKVVMGWRDDAKQALSRVIEK